MIVDIVKTICESLTSVTATPVNLAWLFTDGELYELDENEGDAARLRPFAMLVHPITAVDKVGRFVDTTVFLIKIFLLQQSNFEDKQRHRNVILGRMYDYRNELKAKFNAHADVDEVKNIRSEEIFNAFSDNFDGLEIDLEVKFNPSAFC